MAAECCVFAVPCSKWPHFAPVGNTQPLPGQPCPSPFRDSISKKHLPPFTRLESEAVNNAAQALASALLHSAFTGQRSVSFKNDSERCVNESSKSSGLVLQHGEREPIVVASLNVGDLGLRLLKLPLAELDNGAQSQVVAGLRQLEG